MLPFAGGDTGQNGFLAAIVQTVLFYQQHQQHLLASTLSSFGKVTRTYQLEASFLFPVCLESYENVIFLA